MKQKLLTALFSFAALGLGGYILVREFPEVTKKFQSSLDEISELTSKPLSELIASSSPIIIVNQPVEGSSIMIDMVHLDQPGYIAISTLTHENLAIIVGTSTILATGTHEKILIPIGFPEATSSIIAYASIIVDDGDGMLDHGKDVPLILGDQLIAIPFMLYDPDFIDAAVEDSGTTSTPPIAAATTTRSRLPHVRAIDEATNPTAKIKEIIVTLRQFAFDPATITVQKGDTVRLLLKSMDVEHGILISEFGVNELVVPGKTKTVQFVAAKAGSFHFVCSVFCGKDHASMIGTLIVEE